MWTINKKIWEEVTHAREDGLSVRYRISIPDFEVYIGDSQKNKDKPINAYIKISDDDLLKSKIQELIKDLQTSSEHNPEFITENVCDSESYIAALLEKYKKQASCSIEEDELEPA